MNIKAMLHLHDSAKKRKKKDNFVLMIIRDK